MPEAERELSVTPTPIPGLLLVDLPLHSDSRGWFKENWQRERLRALGVPDLHPVQHNVAFNPVAGTTRGVHAEPWNKWVSVASGRVFGAWVDLRDGPSFGTLFTAEIDPSRAVFVPRGVGNAYQTLDPDTAYTYLVDDHWTPDAEYSCLNLADETVGIPWPIPLSRARLSEKDRTHPHLHAVRRVPPKKTLVIGALGQLGHSLHALLGDAPHLEYRDRHDLDIADPGVLQARAWSGYDTIINAAAFTAVDLAETPRGRVEAWKANVRGVENLARIARDHDITLVHISTDYVFDGQSDRPYSEDDPVTPLGVYGQTKAAADAIVATVARHYIVRTSWLIGEGRNFVRTMLALADRGESPAVVDDQHGRPTFAEELARGILHLISQAAAYGTYNLTGDGEPATWADIARVVFESAGHDPRRIVDVSTEEYLATATGPVAPRPRNSVLDLSKLTSTGFHPQDWRASMRRHLG